MSDALLRRLLRLRQEEPDVVRQYIREAFHRADAGLPQQDPNVFFQAPPDWAAPKDAQQTYDSLTEDRYADSGQADVE